MRVRRGRCAFVHCVLIVKMYVCVREAAVPVLVYVDRAAPAQGTPVYTYRPPQMHTAEMQTPPSVTEHTTRLLDQQSDDAEQERR